MTDYVLVGGGAFSREIFDWFAPMLASRGDRFCGYIDDAHQPMKAAGRDLPQLGDTTTYRPDPARPLVLTIGNPTTKETLVERLGGAGATFGSLIHPAAWVSASAKVGQGVVVGPFALISADSIAGDHVTVNTHSSIGHDVKVGAYSTLSAYVDLTGGVVIGRRSFFGSGARVLPRLKVGDDCVIGAGAVVVRSVKDGSTLYAAPARRL